MYPRTCKSDAQSDDGMMWMGAHGDANVLRGSEWCISYLQEGIYSE